MKKLLFFTLFLFACAQVTPAPPPTATPQTSVFSGEASTLTEAVPLAAGPVEIGIIHNGEGRFYVVLVDEKDQRTPVIDSVSGHFVKTEKVTVAGGRYRLDIFATGKWVVSVKQ